MIVFLPARYIGPLNNSARLIKREKRLFVCLNLLIMHHILSYLIEEGKLHNLIKFHSPRTGNAKKMCTICDFPSSYNITQDLNKGIPPSSQHFA